MRTDSRKLSPPVPLVLFALTLAAGCEEDHASLALDAASTAVDGARKDGAVASSDAAVRTDSAMPTVDGGSASGPQVTAAGIGVRDLDASTAFYMEVMGLSFRYALETPVWSEKVLQDVRGNHVVLMDFVRERNTSKNPVKLVFAVRDSAEYQQKVIAAGGSSASPPQTFAGTTVALSFDLDGYLVELIQVPTVPSPVLVAVGIGVSSLDDAADFYTRLLGFKFVRDIDVPGFMDEKELASPRMKGPSIVLMHYEDQTRTYADIPAKIVLNVESAASYAARIAADDPARILEQPAPYGDAGLVVGMARDIDGYLLEILETAGSGDGAVPRALDGGGR
jgi:lactoylglutathione lyase